MRIKRNYLEAGAFILVYLFALYLWTLPFQDNQIPYGEFDAISHWQIADSFAQMDRTYVYLPPFISYSYDTDNKYKYNTLWYHPPFHTNLGMIASFANDRVIPIYLTNAIFATSILITVFFVMRKLFGFLPAILSSFLLTFSLRDIMPYLWGQWPERFSYAFIPLILYCFYMYYTTYTKEKSKPIYLYFMFLFLAVNLMIHPLGFVHSSLGLFVLGIALTIKQKKIHFNLIKHFVIALILASVLLFMFPYQMIGVFVLVIALMIIHKKIHSNLKHLVIALILVTTLLSIFPFQTGNVYETFKSEEETSSQPTFSRLFSWSFDPEDFVGSVPASYFSFKDMHGLWTLPFLLLGILVLAIRRQNRDIFLLAWLISLYLVLHRDFIGITDLIHRSLSATAHIFVPITVLGALSIASFIKLPKIYSLFLKYGLAALIVVLALVYNMPQAFSTLDQAYDSPIIRLNPAQIEVSEWLKDNIDESQNVSIIGTPAQLMQKVWWMSSISHRVSHFFEGFLTWPKYSDDPEIARGHLLNDTILFDYSDIGRLSDRSLAEQWLAFEQQNLQNHTLIYNKDNIRVYKYETSR